MVLTGTVQGMNDGCTAAAFPAGASGKIVMVSRGTCFFTEKVRNAQAAGAVALVVADNRPGDPVLMGGDGTPNQPTLPAYSVSREDGQSLLAANGMGATVVDALQYYLTTHQNIMADFSSQGPTDVDFRVKPDVVAPGVNVLSSIPASECATPPCFAFFQGTSMAAPHLAGSAAVVRQQHADWSATEVRSAIVNTADRGVLRDATNGLLQDNVSIQGAGRENLLAAVNAKVALDPVSLSFGSVPSGSGQTMQSTVTLTNLTGASQTLTLSISGQNRRTIASPP